MKRKFFLVILLLTIAMVPVVLTPPTTANMAETDQFDFSLALGAGKFWPSAPENVNANVPDPALCGIAGPCWNYKLKIAPEGSRLRVALGVLFQEPGDVRSWPDLSPIAPDMSFTLRLIGPDGTVIEERSTHSSAITAYAIEVFADHPQDGIWTVQVIPTNVFHLAFRMRAKLEGPDEEGGVGGAESIAVPLSPNLRVAPPYEFSFNTPTASYGPGALIPGVHPSCMAEEIREATEEAIRSQEDPFTAVPTLCLRYTMGLENTGAGPFRLMGWLALREGEVSADASDEIMTQRQLYSDGTYKDEAFGTAGKGRLDPTHGHVHWQNAWKFELFRVADPAWKPEDRRPELIAVGPGRKLGIMPSDEFLADWGRFYQSKQNEPLPTGRRADCVFGDTFLCNYDQAINLRKGWGDFYEWNRGGNYVSFPATASGVPLEGYYVLQGVTDPEGLIVETNEDDNVSYALIHVFTDGRVELLERGYGRDPWDPHKEVLPESP
jgi:hypothetical protein